MENKLDYAVNLFREHFERFKEKRIAIYGIGANTKVIMEHCNEFNIVALLDPTMVGKVLYNIPIISYEELLDYQIDMVIIVARYSHLGIIYSRIAEYCKENNVPVYDINGNLMGSKASKVVENEKISVSKEELLKRIQSSDIVSFDIFDTLLMRKTLYPTDVFEFVEKKAKREKLQFINFAKIRINAEKRCNLKQVPSIFDIYEEMARENNLSKDICQKYMDLEFEMEKKLLCVREDMLDIFQEAKEKKEVYLISDMYWPNEYLEDILFSLGIEGYKKLYVSCEYGKTKASGLFTHYIKEIQGKKYLHIGDNYEVDFLMAQRNGIEAYHIFSAYEMLRKSEDCILLKHENKMNLSARYMVGRFIAKVYSSPFVFETLRSKEGIEDGRTFGYVYLAPIITQYMLWLSENVDKEDSVILFSSRDGYLLKVLYDEWKKIRIDETFTESVYYLTSRMNAVLTGIIEEKDIIVAVNEAFSGCGEEMLKKRFFLEDKDVLERVCSEDLNEYILRHKEKIIKTSNYYTNNMKKYFSKVMNEKKTYYWIDFVSSGTCQYYFSKLIQGKVKGLYFYRLSTESKEKSLLSIDALYGVAHAFEADKWLLKMYTFLENIITSYKPTLKCFNEDGTPIYLPEKRGKEQIQELKKIHEGIVAYFREFIELDLNQSNFLEIPDVILGIGGRKYSDEQVDLDNEYIFEDEFTNRKFSLNTTLRGE